MFRALLIPLGNCELPTWSLPQFQVECASDEEDGIRSLKAQLRDVVVVVARGGSAGAAELCSRVEAACGQDVVPLVLAAHGDDLRATEVLEALPLDGFVDLGWKPGLVERCLSSAIHRVRAGRGVAEIQQQVLRAVREEMAQLQARSLRDELTGLYNLRYFREVLEREHPRCQRSNRGYALIRFDLDNLQELNGTYGPSVGTRALTRVGVALSSTLRTSDYAFRVFEDAFACLLLEADRVAARQYAERICSTLRQCVLMTGDSRASLRVSAGISLFPPDGSTLEEVLERAETAVFRAKAAERDRVVLWDEAAGFMGGTQSWRG